MDVNVNSDRTIDTLNDLLRGEMAAVETYEQALTKIEDNFSAKVDLEECRASHQQRVERLLDTIVGMGGEPASNSGAWGSFARLVEGSAKILGPRMTINALEEGEDHGLKEYRETIDRLDAPARQLVSNELLPAQLRTHGTLSALKRSMDGKNQHH